MRHQALADSRHETPFELAARRSIRLLLPVIYMFSAFVFVSDLERDNTLAYGIIYAPLVATAVFYRRAAALWVLTVIACVLVVVGAFFPVVNSDLPDLIGNRALSIGAIWATAAFVSHARATQNRLARETRRAEAAERVKTDVLTTLSTEIRTPMHSLLGVLTLAMSASRPDQRAVLRNVRNDGRRLLSTIDNLIDLSQLETRTLRREPVDMAEIALEATDNANNIARERQVTVTMAKATSPDRNEVIGDSWAIRRVLDNLLANAVRETPAGGSVAVSVSRSADMISASVSDAGKGLPPGLTEDFDAATLAMDRGALPNEQGTGLALSSQLARTMDGRLTAYNRLGSGAVVSLSLPAA